LSATRKFARSRETSASSASVSKRMQFPSRGCALALSTSRDLTFFPFESERVAESLSLTAHRDSEPIATAFRPFVQG